MSEGLGPGDPTRIETFPSWETSQSRLDLQPLWRLGAAAEGPNPRLLAMGLRLGGSLAENRTDAACATAYWPGSAGPAAPLPPRLNLEEGAGALEHPWGARHRPDWAARGLIIWPRGGIWRRLRLDCVCPAAWQRLGVDVARARLALRWWADQALLLADGEAVRGGDLFDTACRWELPASWWQGKPLRLELWLRSPLHDDGALVRSRLELEPRQPEDPLGLLQPDRDELQRLRIAAGRAAAFASTPGSGTVHVLGHAHLDLAWLWPVADTWRAAERTFRSALALMDRFPDLYFGHSTPALYAWLEDQRPALFEQVRRAMRAGRWEPLNGPWVESDCVLLSTASLLRQFQEGQDFSLSRFPEWQHNLAWLPDSFGFAAGLPAVASATGVRWFCTHKLAWNATNPFPHRVFRWRSRCGAELLALMTAPIGTDGDPVAIETERLAWQAASGVDDLLWLPGVGDHGGGPTAEMLEQLDLWRQQQAAVPQRHGSVRAYLQRLEPLAAQLPVWRDELYLELHRGCPTSRPDQKRHNRSLERLLREAELAQALAAAMPWDQAGGRGSASAVALTSPARLPRASDELPELSPGFAAAPTEPLVPVDWRPLLFQQFHDILPGTAIPEVFEQAEPIWRAARRRARRQRDAALASLLGLESAARAASAAAAPITAQRTAAAAQGGRADRSAGPSDTDPAPGQRRRPSARGAETWVVAQLQPLAAQRRILRLPAGSWRLASPTGPRPLPQQPAAAGGCWVQLPGLAGVCSLTLQRASSQGVAATATASRAASPGECALEAPGPELGAEAEPIAPVRVELLDGADGQRWRLVNDHLAVSLSSEGIEQLQDAAGRPLLAAPLRWQRWRDAGEFWDAWDLAADHRQHPLPWDWDKRPQWLERGPLSVHVVWRGRCGRSAARLDVRLQAGSPWLELVVSLHWRQRHELLQLEVPLAQPACRWASDTAGGVIERAAAPRTAPERARWEVASLSWIAALASPQAGDTPDLAVLLDGPQGVSATPERLSVSLLRAPTWPDPGADNGWQRQRLALMPSPGGWRASAVPAQARRLREPLWRRPLAAPARREGLLLPPLAPDLELVQLRPLPACPGELLLTLQNNGPCRQHLDLGADWQVRERLDGLGHALQPQPEDPTLLGPWQLGFWRVRSTLRLA
ncbi:MAG: alpha-mannosidase [Synechococcaceae cyanobacterium]